MNESNENKPNQPTASLPTKHEDAHGAVNFAKFAQLRADRSLSDEQFARTVFSLPQFEQKRKQVADILSRQWPAERVDDAMQKGALRVYFHLVATRGIQFSGVTDDALGAWLFALLHRNAQWELAKIARGEQRRRSREIAASRPESNGQMSNTEFAGKVGQVFAMIEKLPAPLSTVGFDLHYGVTAKKTAKTCGISERRVYELRSTILCLVSEMLDDIC